MRRLGMLAAAPLLALGAAPATAVPTDPLAWSAPVTCDRACLSGLLDQVLDAMASNDTSRLPLARNVAVTENGVLRSLHDGLWQTATGRGHYRIDIIDPESGQAAFVGTMMEDGKPVYMTLRMAVREQKIAEIETVITREGFGPGNTPGERIDKATPRLQFARDIPAREQGARADLARIADSYFANLQGSTGLTSAPFAKSCNRIENGGQTTNLKTHRPGRESYDVLTLGCEAQQRSGFYAFVTGIRNRRYPVIDREKGLVLSFSYWDHTATVRELKLANGMTVPAPFRAPLTFQNAELFQIDRGQIDQIEAVLFTAPYGMRSDVWDRP